MSKKPTLEELLSANLEGERKRQKPPSAQAPRLQLSENVPALWVEIERVEDNPFQPRLEIEESELEKLIASIDENGQLQAVLVRAHPTRPGEYQLAAGHRRKYAVKRGANAGIKTSDPHDKIGKILATVALLNDEQMLAAAWSENEDRENFTVFDRANFFQMAKKLTPGSAPGKEISWKELAKKHSLAETSLARIVAVRLLPENVRERLAKINFAEKGERLERASEKHVRALQMLEGNAQMALLREIESEKISGNEALRRADKVRADAKPAMQENASEKREYSQSSGGAQSAVSFEVGKKKSSGARNDAPQDYEPPSGITVSRSSSGDALLGHLAQAAQQTEIAAGAVTSAKIGAAMRARVLAEIVRLETQTQKIRAALEKDA